MLYIMRKKNGGSWILEKYVIKKLKWIYGRF